MRLFLIVLVAGLMASCSFLDKTPGEALGAVIGAYSSWLENIAVPWIFSLFDAHITVGDIIVYILAGFTIVIWITNKISDRQQAENDPDEAGNGKGD